MYFVQPLRLREQLTWAYVRGSGRTLRRELSLLYSTSLLLQGETLR
jgi:hypothetical protein